jgi:hypothetical protein
VDRLFSQLAIKSRNGKGWKACRLGGLKTVLAFKLSSLRASSFLICRADVDPAKMLRPIIKNAGFVENNHV